MAKKPDPTPPVSPQKKGKAAAPAEMAPAVATGEHSPTVSTSDDENSAIEEPALAASDFSKSSKHSLQKPSHTPPGVFASPKESGEEIKAMLARLNRQRLREDISQLTPEERAAYFAQRQKEREKWFGLRLIMGYFTIVILLVVMGASVYIILNSTKYTNPVVLNSAVAALFSSVLGSFLTGWKIVLTTPDL